jgi:hypothetical protein
LIRTYDSNYRGECRSEMCEQIDSASWLEFNYPERWPLIFHVPNEISAKPQYMQRRKKEGVKPGVSDIIDFGSIRGAFELKRLDRTKCKVTPDQREFLESVDASGGFAAICYGFAEFRRAYVDYLAFCAIKR